MDLRRLEFLLELSRLGSMREVAEELHTTTSTVSQQLAALAREVGTPLLEPVGRRVRLTPAGHRLTGHAVSILAAVEAARLDLDTEAEPVGTLRVAGFATAVRRTLLPIVRHLAEEHPRVHMVIHEHEPAEAFELLASDSIDLALTYDYNLAPATFERTLEPRPLWSTGWGLAVPADSVPHAPGASPEVFSGFREADWIVNSRSTADEEVVGTIASMAGFAARVRHRADSLELVQDLIVAGLGVGLLPLSMPIVPGVTVLPLRDPDVDLRAYAVTRGGRAAWPPLALVLGMIAKPEGTWSEC